MGIEAVSNITKGGVSAFQSGVGGSSAIKGSAVVDFGAGETFVSIAVASTEILAGSVASAFVMPSQTDSNGVEEHAVEDLDVCAGAIQAGVGFTIYAKCNTGRAYGKFNIGWTYN